MPCSLSREAWSKLGDTSKEEAMESYVCELKEVMMTRIAWITGSASKITSITFYKLSYP